MAEAGTSLFALLRERKKELLDRWSQQVDAALASEALSRSELVDHIPVFIDELVGALYPDAVPLPGMQVVSAEEHGAQRLRLGFNVGEVVREYGILHLCILELAHEAGVAITFDEQQIIGRWLNAGIANAVSQYGLEREAEMQRQAAEHLGFLAHELRNPLSAARMAFQVIRSRDLAAPNRTVEILERNLSRAADVIDSTLTHAWLKMGVSPRLEPLRLRQFLHEIEVEGGAEAQTKNIDVTIDVADDLVLEADPRLLRSAISNLFRNAVKFSRPEGKVRLHAAKKENRILIEVADSCGGLPPGKAEELFVPLVQKGEDRSGFGLGLAIAQQAVEAHHGSIQVHDHPGVGCVFILNLPSS